VAMRDALAQLIAQYLAGHPCHRHWVVRPAPIPRRSGFSSAQWQRLLRRVTWEDPERREIAESALSDLTRLAPWSGSRDWRVIDRAILQDQARAVRADPSDDNLIRLWVAVRVWGGLSRFGPRHVRDGLEDPALIDQLRTSASAILAPPVDLSELCRGFTVAGTGLSYASKWFWAVSLAHHDADSTTGAEGWVRPLILDRRVRETLSLVAEHGGAAWTDPVDATGYRDYVELLHDTVPLVGAQGQPIVDAERIEWLLFDRRPWRRGRGREHDWTGEECFVDWLRRVR
jgi:hypothetical protein